MKVSVVIPCYNRSAFISRAIDTVKAQTHSDWEILVIDDGSDDLSETRSVVEGFRDPRIRLYALGENVGQTAATNVGMKLASGEFIALLDSDDVWDPRKLELQLELFLEVNESKAVVFPQSIIKTNRDGPVRETVMPDLPPVGRESVMDYLFCRRGFIQSSGLFFSRSLIENVSMRDGLRRHTDYDFLIALEQYGCRFCLVAEPLVVVNWLDVNLRKGARDMSASFEFLEHNARAFSCAAHTTFVLRQIILPLLAGRSYFKQALRGFRTLHPIALGLSGYLSLLSVLLFKDERLLVKAAELKKYFCRS